MDLYNGSSWTEGAKLSSGGVLTVNGFGTHTFSAGGTGANALTVTNTTSGTGNYASHQATAGTTNGYFNAYSQGYTTSGYALQSGVAVYGDGSGGVSIAATNASGDVRLYSRNTLALTMGASQAATFAGALSIPATSKLYLDGGGDTYIYERTSNALGLVAGSTQALELNATGLAMPSSNPTSASAANCVIANGDYLRISTSSARYKRDIETLDADHAVAAVLAMRPVTYRGKTDDDQRRHVGFIAEEMQEIAPLLCTYDEGGESGTPNYVTYDRVTAYLVSVVQKQQAEIDALKARVH
jgi:hypothetical protein